MVPLYTLLGLFDDGYDLLYNNKNDSRKFKTSILSPFSTNIFFKLHQCESNEYPNGKFYISLQVNEKQYPLPHCPSNSTLNQFYCHFDEIFNYYNNSLFSSFDFNSYCGVEGFCSSFENEIQSLKDQIDSLEKKKTLATVFIALFVGFVLISIFSFFMYKRMRKREREFYQI